MIDKIIAKHSNDFEAQICDEEDALTREMYAHLQEKWAHKVPPGWYGFDLPDAPVRWLKIIDEFLDYIDRQDPNMEIHQIKLKFGGLRFYVDCSPRFRDEIITLENTLYCSKLIK